MIYNFSPGAAHLFRASLSFCCLLLFVLNPRLSGHLFPSLPSCPYYTVPLPTVDLYKTLQHANWIVHEVLNKLAYIIKVPAEYPVTLFLNWTLVLLVVCRPQVPWVEAALSLSPQERLESGDSISFIHRHHFPTCKRLCSLLAYPHSLCCTTHCGLVLTSLDRALAKKLMFSGWGDAAFRTESGWVLSQEIGRKS